MQSDQDIRKTTYGRRRFSSIHPLLDNMTKFDNIWKYLIISHIIKQYPTISEILTEEAKIRPTLIMDSAKTKQLLLYSNIQVIHQIYIHIQKYSASTFTSNIFKYSFVDFELPQTFRHSFGLLPIPRINSKLFKNV